MKTKTEIDAEFEYKESRTERMWTIFLSCGTFLIGCLIAVAIIIASAYGLSTFLEWARVSGF